MISEGVANTTLAVVSGDRRYVRLTVNAVFWCLGMEKLIRPDLDCDYVGPYEPLESGFNYKKLGVKPRKPETYR